MASDINKVFLIGRLTRDPELRQTSGGKSFCKFGLANNFKFGERQDSYFFDCAAWNKTGELVAQYLKKGSQVAIEGRLVQNTWDKDGLRHSRVEIHVEAVQFLSRGTMHTQREEEEMPF